MCKYMLVFQYVTCCTGCMTEITTKFARLYLQIHFSPCSRVFLLAWPSEGMACCLVVCLHTIVLLLAGLHAHVNPFAHMYAQSHLCISAYMYLLLRMLLWYNWWAQSLHWGWPYCVYLPVVSCQISQLNKMKLLYLITFKMVLCNSHFGFFDFV